MSVVLHFQSSGSIPGDGRPVTMVGNSLTIGRGKGNDLVLPDPDRVISSRHCAIEDQNGNVVVIDLSTNGTFLNYGKVPLGKVPTPLNDGDILSIGNYELAVDLSGGTKEAGPELLDPVGSGPVAPKSAAPDGGIADLLDAAPTGGGKDVISELLDKPGSPVGPKGVKRPELGEDGLLPPLGEDVAGDPLSSAPDPDELLGSSQAMNNPSVQDNMVLPQAAPSTIPDDWDLDLPGGPVSVEAPEDPFDTKSDSGVEGSGFIPDDLDEAFGEADGGTVAPRGSTPAPRPAAPKPKPKPASRPKSSAAKTGASGEQAQALRVLLEAAGVGELEVPEDEIEETAARLGNVLRIMIHGMREILMTRSSIKSEFRMEQTRISASGNNALKFSVTPEQAVEVLAGPPKRGYLSAEASTEQALQDIKAHEVATMSGMEAALKGILHKLSPDELEAHITSAGGLGGLLKGRKARYWETYERIYSQVADAAENDFHELFSREFARAYQEQLEQLKDET